MHRLVRRRPDYDVVRVLLDTMCGYGSCQERRGSRRGGRRRRPRQRGGEVSAADGNSASMQPPKPQYFAVLGCSDEGLGCRLMKMSVVATVVSWSGCACIVAALLFRTMIVF